MRLKIGSLGTINFKKGIYAYVGSAQNNIKKRVERHISRQKKIFWHIDYLLRNRYTRVVQVFYKEAGRSWECKIARRLTKTESPVLGFGCSDCRCVSHLLKVCKIDIPIRGLKEFL